MDYIAVQMRGRALYDQQLCSLYAHSADYGTPVAETAAP